MRHERLDLLVPEPEEPRDVGGGAVAEADPDHLGRRPAEHAQAVEVLVLGHPDEALGRRVCPHPRVGRAREPGRADVRPAREHVRQRLGQARREVLVDEQLQS